MPSNNNVEMQCKANTQSWILQIPVLHILVMMFLVLPNSFGLKLIKPNLTSEANVVTLDEAQDSKMTLTHLRCDGPDGGAALLSVDNVNPAKPCGQCFSILPCPEDDSWCLEFTPLEPMDISRVKDYAISLRCATPTRQTSKGQIHIRLFRETKAPSFESFSRVVTLDEAEDEEVILRRIICNDPDDTEVKVDLKVESKLSKNGCSKCFTVEPCDMEWCLKFVPGVGTLSYVLEPIYPMTLECTDSDGEMASADLEVRLTKNLPPAFEKVYDSIKFPSTSLITTGSLLYHVIASDKEMDQMFFTMTTTPHTPQMTIGFSDGIIAASQDFEHVCSPQITCKVEVTDRYHKNSQHTLTIDIHFAENVPSLTSVDETVQIPENLLTTVPIYKVNVENEDRFQGIHFTMTTNPTSGSGHFSLKDDGVILTRPLNFEDPANRKSVLTLTAVNSRGCVVVTRQVAVEVTDVNEPPTLASNRLALSVYEGNIAVQPPWKVTDEDQEDVQIFQIVGGNSDGLFSVQPETGQITSLIDYDVDNNKMATNVSLTVQVSDRGGLTAEAEVLLDIMDANDNAPNILGGSRTFIVTECDGAGHVIGQLEAADEDSSFQGNSRVSLVSIETGTVSLVSSGHILLTSQMAAGQTVTIEAFAVDEGKYPRPLQSTRPVSVSVHCRICSPGDRNWERANPNGGTLGKTSGGWSVVEESLWWISPSIFLASILASLVAFMCWKYSCCTHYFRCARLHPRRPAIKPSHLSKVWPHNQKTGSLGPKVRSVTPAPVSDMTPVESSGLFVVHPPNNTYDFWKESFADEDYTAMPDRNRKPLPCHDLFPDHPHHPPNHHLNHHHPGTILHHNQNNILHSENGNATKNLKIKRKQRCTVC